MTLTSEQIEALRKALQTAIRDSELHGEPEVGLAREDAKGILNVIRQLTGRG